MKKFYYRVREKDSVISVSKKFGVPTMLLISDNLLKSEIKAGDVLLIKSRKNCYEVEPLDTLYLVSIKLGVTVERLSFLNGGIAHVFYGLILTY